MKHTQRSEYPHGTHFESHELRALPEPVILLAGNALRVVPSNFVFQTIHRWLWSVTHSCFIPTSVQRR